MSTYSNHISHYINTQNVWDGYEGDEDIIDLDIPIENDMWGNLTDEEILSDILSEDTYEDYEDYEYYEDTFEDYEDYENNWDIYGNLCGENCIGCGYCYDDNNTNNDNEYDNEYNNEHDPNENEHNNDNNNDNNNTDPLFNCHFLRCDHTICDGWCSKI